MREQDQRKLTNLDAVPRFAPRLSITIPGRAVTNKSVQVGRGRGRKPEECKAYQQRVWVAWHEAGRPRLDCSNGIVLSYRRYYPRPKSHFDARGGIKDSVPLVPISRNTGDVDNLLKLAIDALNGYAWKDDARIAGHSHNAKLWLDDDLGERVVIRAEPITTAWLSTLECLEARESIARGEGLSFEEVFGEEL